MNTLEQMAKADYTSINPKYILPSEWYAVYTGAEKIGLGEKMAIAYSQDMKIVETLLKKYKHLGYYEKTTLNKEFFGRVWFGIVKDDTPLAICMFENHAKEIKEQFAIDYRKIKIDPVTYH